MMTKIWRDHAKMGGELYYYKNGAKPYQYTPPKINNISAEAWSNGVPEVQKLITNYSCNL